jgi:hypothetical protein
MTAIQTRLLPHTVNTITKKYSKMLCTSKFLMVFFIDSFVSGHQKRPYIYFRYRGYVCISEISLSIESLFYNNEKNVLTKNDYDQVYFVTNNIKLVFTNVNTTVHATYNNNGKLKINPIMYNSG